VQFLLSGAFELSVLLYLLVHGLVEYSAGEHEGELEIYKNVFRERMIGIIIACRRPLVRKKISYSSTLSLLPIGLSPVDGRFVLSVDEALLWLGGVFASTLSITLIPLKRIWK